MQIHTPFVPTQRIYRQLLKAMSHPGRVFPISLTEWDSLLLAVGETLLDHEVSFCVLSDAPPEWEREIFALTKAQIAPVQEADYLIVKGNDSHGTIRQAKLGVPFFPDQGATVLYVSNVARDDLVDFAPLLSGPGLEEASKPDLNPLSQAEWELLHELNSEYPLGVDAICLIGNCQVMCIPRSTKIRLE